MITKLSSETVYRIAVGTGLFLSFLVSSTSVFAMAKPAPKTLKIGRVLASGTGCPNGAVSAKFDEQEGTVEVSLDRMAAELDKTNPDGLDRKACSVAIPVLEVPAGHRVVVTQAKASGNYELAAGIEGQARMETFLAGALGETVIYPLESSTQDVASDLEMVQYHGPETECGRPGSLRANLSSLVRKTLDSAGNTQESRLGLSELKLSLHLEPCS